MVHVAILLIALFKVVLFPEQALDLSTAIRVDMVDLPDKFDPNKLPEKVQQIEKEKLNEPIVKDTTKLPEKPKPEDDVINLAKAKDKQKAALDKLKKLNALDKIKQEVKKENTPPPVFKGRVIAPGSQIGGLDKLQSDSYLGQLDAQIKSRWSLPQWLIGKPYKTRVLVKFDVNGQILSRKIMQTSGNPTYDDYCVAAIDQSAPFPKVPEKFADVYRIDGVVIGFPE